MIYPLKANLERYIDDNDYGEGTYSNIIEIDVSKYGEDIVEVDADGSESKKNITYLTETAITIKDKIDGRVVIKAIEHRSITGEVLFYEGVVE